MDVYWILDVFFKRIKSQIISLFFPWLVDVIKYLSVHSKILIFIYLAVPLRTYNGYNSA